MKLGTRVSYYWTLYISQNELDRPIFAIFRNLVTKLTIFIIIYSYYIIYYILYYFTCTVRFSNNLTYQRQSRNTCTLLKTKLVFLCFVI